MADRPLLNPSLPQLLGLAAQSVRATIAKVGGDVPVGRQLEGKHLLADSIRVPGEFTKESVNQMTMSTSGGADTPSKQREDSAMPHIAQVKLSERV